MKSPIRMLQLFVALFATVAAVAFAPAANAAPRTGAAAVQVASIQAAIRSGDVSLIKDGPDLSAAQLVRFSRVLATALKNPVRELEPGLSKPDASVGFGWYIYLRFSPAEQRFILEAGPGVVAGMICLASAGTACVVAGMVAGVIAAWVSNFYNPRCWIELKVTYPPYPRVVGVNRYWRCYVTGAPNRAQVHRSDDIADGRDRLWAEAELRPG